MRAIIGDMELVPLRQWMCDTCGEIIESADDGYLEWVRDDENRAYDFRIVHRLSKSPRREHSAGGCYQHGSPYRRQDASLDTFLGEDVLAHLLAFLDLGQIDPEDTGPHVQSTRELVELVRRLMLPHYEEARLHWSDAQRDGFFDGANEVSPYSQRLLRSIVENYAPRELNSPDCARRHDVMGDSRWGITTAQNN